MNNSIAVIASFPPKGTIHHKTIVGGASYTKNLLVHLADYAKAKKNPLHITVLAEHFPGQKKTAYTEQGIVVKRIWKRGRITLFPALFSQLLTTRSKTIVIAFELAMFGSLLQLIPLAAFVCMLKLLNKEIICIYHQVIADANQIHGHINLPKRSMRIDILNIFLKIFYTLTLACVSRAVVFEEELKTRLSTFGNAEKIIVIVHMVPPVQRAISRSKARALLKLPQKKYILLSFGFLAWYKGTDLLIDECNKVRGKNTLLVIAGGPNPNHTAKPYYQRYITTLKQKAAASIVLPGFVPEEHIGLYFAACDAVIFPYRTFMSSSGPLSFAWSYHKPVLLSMALAPYQKTADFQKALAQARISIDTITMSINYRDLEKKVLWCQKNSRKLVRFSELMTQYRQPSIIAQHYYELFT